MKRHTQLHVRKGKISEQNVNKLSSIMSHSQKQRGKSRQRNASRKRKKGRFKKWCPVPGCDSIIVNIGRHLSARKGHNIKKNSAHYIRLLKTAHRYTGTAELQTYLGRPNESKEEEHEEEEGQEDEQEEFQMEQGSQSADGMEEKTLKKTLSRPLQTTLKKAIMKTLKTKRRPQNSSSQQLSTRITLING